METWNSLLSETECFTLEQFLLSVFNNHTKLTIVTIIFKYLILLNIYYITKFRIIHLYLNLTNRIGSKIDPGMNNYNRNRTKILTFLRVEKLTKKNCFHYIFILGFGGSSHSFKLFRIAKK